MEDIMAGDIKKLQADKYRADMANETFNCKNPILLKALKENPSSLDIAFPANSAEELGKRLQVLLKGQDTKVTEKILYQAIGDVEKYDEVNNDALCFRRDNTLQILMATWDKGEEVATCLGINAETYKTMCKNMNKNYANVEKTDDNQIQR
jgi:hypothetical protein